MSQPLTGGCNCGAVRYEITAPLLGATYCHCRRCQRRSGTAVSASAHPAPGSFRVVAGGDDLRMWQPEGGGEKWFCGVCGSHVYGNNPALENAIGVRLGTFDSDPGVRPSRRVWTSSAAVWEDIPDDGLPRYPAGRAGAPPV